MGSRFNRLSPIDSVPLVVGIAELFALRAGLRRTWSWARWHSTVSF